MIELKILFFDSFLKTTQIDSFELFDFIDYLNRIFNLNDYKIVSIITKED